MNRLDILQILKYAFMSLVYHLYPINFALSVSEIVDFCCCALLMAFVEWIFSALQDYYSPSQVAIPETDTASDGHLAFGDPQEDDIIIGSLPTLTETKPM